MRLMLEGIEFVECGVFSSEDPWIHPRIATRTTELIVMIKGEAHLAEDGVEYDVPEKGYIFLEPRVAHWGTRYSQEEVAFYWFHFMGKLPENFVNKVGVFAERDRIEILCRQLLHYANTPTCHRSASDYSLRLLLLEISQQCKYMVGGTMLFSEICEWIRIRGNQPMTSGDVAEHFGYHEDYLARLFRKKLNCSLKQFINQSRMAYLKTQLLSTTLPLKEIAQRAGFREYKYFLKFFTFHEGMTPTAFRNIYFNTHENRE